MSPPDSIDDVVRAVTLLTKAPFGRGGASVWAQGGIAAAVGADDSPALHASDTLSASAGLADPEIVGRLAAEGPARVEALAALGAAAALARRESRGGHYRADHPAPDPRLRRRAFVVAGDTTPS